LKDCYDNHNMENISSESNRDFTGTIHKEVKLLKILNTSLIMGSQYLFTKQYKSSEALKFIDNTHIKTSDKSLNSELIKQSLSDYLELSKEALDKARSDTSKSSRVITLEDLKDLDIPDKDKLKILLLVKMVKAITGK
jgi:hypothetical protein